MVSPITATVNPVAAAAAAAAAATAAAQATAIAAISTAWAPALAALQKYYTQWPSNPANDTANAAATVTTQAAYNAAIAANKVPGVNPLIKSNATNYSIWLNSIPATAAVLAARPQASAAALALPAFAVGTNFISDDMIAQVHRGEEITPRPYVDMQRASRDETNALLARLTASNDTLVAELKAVKNELADIRRTNQNMDWTTDKWDNEGTPDVRQEATSG